MEIKVIYEDKDVIVVDKPAGMVVFCEGEALKNQEKSLIDYLVEKYPQLKDCGQAPRYGIAHRLDKDTSGILLVAKNDQALIFLQKQFTEHSQSALAPKNKEGLEKSLKKLYIALVEGNIKNDQGIMHTLIARSPSNPKKQTVFQLDDKNAPSSAREAITEWKVIQRYQDFCLMEVEIKTGRKHQIRCHLSFLQHPVAGDKLYGFKNSKAPEGLKRQFLHAKYLKIQLPASRQGGPSGQIKEFESDLPEELKQILNKLTCQNY